MLTYCRCYIAIVHPEKKPAIKEYKWEYVDIDLFVKMISAPRYTWHMVVTQLAVVLSVLTALAYSADANQSRESLEEPQVTSARTLLTTTHSDGRRILRKCGVASTSVEKKRSVQRVLRRHIEARIARNAPRAQSININVFVTINRHGGASDFLHPTSS